MPIASTDLHLRLSVTTGSAGNTTAQGTPNNSLGKYISTTDITDNTLDNLFDDLTGDENAASNVDYHCIFIYNAHATLTLQNAKVWFTNIVAGGTNKAIALDNKGVVAVGSATAQADVIANEDTAPTAVGAFSTPTTKPTGLSIGNIGPGQCAAIWIRRTATNSAAYNSDGCTIRVEGDTAA